MPDISRNSFPAGLSQPEGAGRFGTDALLLGSYGANIAAQKIKGAYPFRAVELGTGCGAAILALAMLLPKALCLGVDISSELVEAAGNNCRLLGLENRVAFFQADLARQLEPFKFADWLGVCDMVVANPPWIRPNSGKVPVSRLRRIAFCGDSAILNAFCSQSSRLLRHKGLLCAIISVNLFTEFVKSLALFGLGLRQLLPVASFYGQPARCLLLMAQKGAKDDPELLAPLVLHGAAQRGAACQWTRDALEFCPWLAGTVA